MNKSKLYFSDLDKERAYALDYIIDEMKENNLSELIVYEAIMELKTDYFYCKAVGEVGIKGNDYEYCGKSCGTYKPRNGKSGCCKFRGFCYEHGEEFKLSIDGKLFSIVAS